MGTTVRSNKLKVVSLFCGCGGMDLGIQGGFEFLNKRFPEDLPKTEPTQTAQDNTAIAIAIAAAKNLAK